MSPAIVALLAHVVRSAVVGYFYDVVSLAKVSKLLNQFNSEATILLVSAAFVCNFFLSLCHCACRLENTHQ
jgi:hypothetical protein